MSKTTVVTFRLDTRTLDALISVADEHEVPTSVVIRTAIRELLERLRPGYADAAVDSTPDSGESDAEPS
jgi:predicted transcriptional regulator